LTKLRVYEVAEELGVETSQLIQMLREMDVLVRSHMSTVDATSVARLHARLERERRGDQPSSATATKTARRRRRRRAAPAEIPASATATEDLIDEPDSEPFEAADELEPIEAGPVVELEAEGVDEVVAVVSAEELETVEEPTLEPGIAGAEVEVESA
jgi:translation initiation factor IF-2